MASTTTTKFEQEVRQHLQTFQKHESKLQTMNVNSVDPQQLATQIGISVQEAEEIAALWPVYRYVRQLPNNSTLNQTQVGQSR